MSSAPSPDRANPFAHPAAPGTSHPLDVIDGAVRIENGTELPHRCVFCNGAGNLLRNEFESVGLPEPARRLVRGLCMTFLLAPLAAILYWRRRQRVKFTASVCNAPAADSECVKQRKRSIEAIGWANMPEVWAGGLGILMACVFHPFVGPLIPENLPETATYVRIYSAVMFVCFFGLAFLLIPLLTPTPVDVKIEDGFFLRGFGPDFLAALQENVRVEPIPANTTQEATRLLPDDIEFRPVRRDGRFVVLPDRTALPRRCALCNSSVEPLAPMMGQLPWVALRPYRNLWSLTLENSWTGLPAVLLVPFTSRLCRPRRWVYFLCTSDRLALIERVNGGAVRRFLLLVALLIVLACITYPLGDAFLRIMAAFPFFLSGAMWILRERRPILAYDCDEHELRVAGCGEPFLQSLEAAPTRDAPQA